MAHRTRQLFKRQIERLFHVKLYGTRVHGREDCADIAGCGAPITTILDVGANVGQSARKFREAFPESTIHCFEPVSHVFDELVANLSQDHRVTCHRTALGSAAGIATIYLTPHSTASSMIASDESTGSETVTVITLDGFAERESITDVDLLKIDAEGFDLEVLRGAERVLASERIKFILVEVGFSPGDHRHVLFDDVRSFLSLFGFKLLGIYDQQVEWSGPRFLRYANVCFCHKSVFDS